jgi:hypothetical protein
VADTFTKAQLLKFAEASYNKGSNDMLDVVIVGIRVAFKDDPDVKEVIANLEMARLEEIEPS